MQTNVHDESRTFSLTRYKTANVSHLLAIAMNHSSRSLGTSKQARNTDGDKFPLNSQSCDLKARGYPRLLPRPEPPKPAIKPPAVRGPQYFSRCQYRYDLAPTNGLKLPVPRRTRVEGLPPNRRTLGQLARWEREYRERQQAPAASLRSYGVTPTTDKQSRSQRARRERERRARKGCETGTSLDDGTNEHGQRALVPSGARDGAADSQGPGVQHRHMLG
ncbi:hypothetical protein FPV67DRAFT_1545146 [Lyophyllum atratum]|nr:hypothetical protein FPV67DRAFT_1545146 [Lyophyllum atratum]